LEVSLRLEVVAATERGLIRERNEDSVGVACDLLSDGELRAWSLVVGNEPTILVIADGVGGHRGGHLASRYAVGAALRKGADLANAGSVASILEHISNEIRLEYLGDLGNRGCSTTIVGITVDDKIIRAFNVGDSRAYIVEKTQLHQVSIDDVLAKPNFGDIPMREQVRSHTITQWLGGR